jgi:predicted lactoylglutathione lyase
MHPSPVTDLRTFLPTQDPELSKKFYTDLGFTINGATSRLQSFRSVLSGSCCRLSRSLSVPAIS